MLVATNYYTEPIEVKAYSIRIRSFFIDPPQWKFECYSSTKTE